MLAVLRILLTRADHPMAKRVLHVIRENNSIDGETDDCIWWQLHDATLDKPQHRSRLIDLHEPQKFFFAC